MSFRGRLLVPGDKSIAHRALMFAAMREGETRILGLPQGGDVRSTMRVLAALGARIEQDAPDACTVRGWGSAGPIEPSCPLDCGNSGTTARLLMGLIAPWDIRARITGDESLRARPMGRVVAPLEMMGARFSVAGDGAGQGAGGGPTLPLDEQGTSCLRGIEYRMPIASAQVKSAILLAGLGAHGRTRVIEEHPTRDHTERLIASGVLEQRGPLTLTIPRDPSSAAFAISAALLAPGSEVVLPGVCLNPTRTAYLDVLRAMGAQLAVERDDACGAEPTGTIAAAYSPELSAIETPAESAALLIDEFPVLALCAAFAAGTSAFRGIGELRVKESDRVQGIIDGLAALGVRAYARPSAAGGTGCAPSPASEDLFVEGRPELRCANGLMLPESAALDSRNDHRLALTWQVAALCADSPLSIGGGEAAGVSYPGFREDMARLSESSMPEGFDD